MSPTFPAGSLLVMNGEGTRLWMKTAPTAGKAAAVRWPHVPSHEVLVPDMRANIGRVWFGRMYLPPRENVLQVHGTSGQERTSMTFGKHIVFCRDSANWSA